MLNFDQLKAPAGDGDILIEPPGSQWPQLLEKNLRHLQQHASKIILAGISVHDLRAQLRQPILVCGHQPAFIHPGVWAKQVAVRHLRDRWQIQAFDLVVDQDAPRSSALFVPVLQPDGLLATRQIEFSEALAGSAYEGRPVLSKTDIGRIEKELAPASNSLMPAYWKGFASAPQPQDSVDQHLSGRHQVDIGFKADLPPIRVSENFGGHFLADLLLNADRFSQAYNDSLAAYRSRERIHESDRPLPDLQRSGQRIETALWIYQPLGRRRRLWLERSPDRLKLYADDVAVGAIGTEQLSRDPAVALTDLQPWVIRPRALTLTLWARLLACDLFVHGIGGAKYDRITDDIFRGYYGCEPPAMACVTATLRLPLPRCNISEADVKIVERNLRDVQYNPQRYLTAPPPAWLEPREQLIRESDRLRAEKADSPRRREIFRDLREIKARLLDSEPDLKQKLAERHDASRMQLQSNRIADSREFFYALQPLQRLQALAEKLYQSMR